MWSDTVLRRIAKCALPSFGEALFIVLNPQYPILATGVLPPRDGPKGSPFFLGRTGVSLIKDMSGAGSSLSPLKSRMIKAPSSSGSRPLFIIEISDAFAIEEHLAGGDMYLYIVSATQADCSFQRMDCLSKLIASHAKGAGSRVIYGACGVVNRLNCGGRRITLNLHVCGCQLLVGSKREICPRAVRLHVLAAYQDRGRWLG